MFLKCITILLFYSLAASVPFAAGAKPTYACGGQIALQPWELVNDGKRTEIKAFAGRKLCGWRSWNQVKVNLKMGTVQIGIESTDNTVCSK
jgi:hypothetical protein